MENPEDRQIYMNRWESVKQTKVFEKNYKKDFAQNRFKRDQFKRIAMRTPGTIVHSTYSYIKKHMLKINVKEK